jgi:hypothetical protein
MRRVKASYNVKRERWADTEDIMKNHDGGWMI